MDQLTKAEGLLNGKRKMIPATLANPAKKAKIDEKKPVKKTKIEEKPAQKNGNKNNQKKNNKQHKPEQYSGIMEEIDDDLVEFKYTRERLQNNAKKLIEAKKLKEVEEMYKAEIKISKSEQKKILEKDMTKIKNYNFYEAFALAENHKKNKTFGFEYFYEKALRLEPYEPAPGIIKEMQQFGKDAIARKLKKLKDITNNKKQYQQSCKEPNNLSINKSRFYVLVHNTVAIEGNEFELNEVERFLTTGETIPKRTPHDHKEVTDAASAIKFANKTIVNDDSQIDLKTILCLHEKIMKTTEPDGCGKLRKEEVFVGPHLPPKHQRVPKLMSGFITNLNNTKAKRHPVEVAARIHHEIANIHPFVDGNGRISRLVMNILLQRNGFPAIDIPLDRREDYYNCLEMCNDGYYEAFIELIADCVVRVLGEYRNPK